MEDKIIKLKKMSEYHNCLVHKCWGTTWYGMMETDYAIIFYCAHHFWVYMLEQLKEYNLKIVMADG